MADYLVSLKADTSQIKKNLEGVGGSLKTLQNQATAFLAVVGGAIAIKAFGKLADAMAAPIAEAQNAAREFENLSIALSLSGQLSEENIKQFQDLGDALETTSIFAGGAVTDAAALSINLGATAEQAKSVVTAAADLAAATGVDLNTATEALTKSLQGQGTQLGKLVPQLRGMKEESLKSGEALNFVAARFQGAAVAAGNTFSGAMFQSREAFNKLLETIGNFIVQNPVVVFLIKAATQGFLLLARVIEENKAAIMAFVQGGIIFLIDAFSVLVTILQKGVIPVIRAVVVGFAGLFDVFTAIANLIGKVLDPIINQFVRIIGNLVGTILKFVSTLSKIPAVSKGLESLGINAEKLAQGFDNAGESAKDLSKSFDAKSLRNSINDAVQGAADTAELGLVGAQNYLGAFNTRVKAFGKQAGALIGTEINKGIKNQGGGAGLPVPVDTEKLKKEIEEAYKQALSNPVQAIFQVAGIKISDEFQSKAEAQLAGIIQGAAGLVNKGAEGARQAIVQTLTSAAKTALGPIGQALGPIIDLFSQGPEKVRETITAFIQAIPTIIENIILSIPALLLALAEQIPIVVERLSTLLPEILPPFLEALIAAIPQLAIALSLAMPRAAIAFTIALVRNIDEIILAIILAIPQMIIEFTAALVSAAWDFIKAIYDAITAIIPSPVSAVTGGGGGGGILGAVGDFFGFAEGGMVPAGYPNDSFPAKLTSGEAILPTDTVQKLENFLNTGGSSGQNVTINLVVGEEQLAKVILNLNRQGFRVS